jgi:hypothetical protein
MVKVQLIFKPSSGLPITKKISKNFTASKVMIYETTWINCCKKKYVCLNLLVFIAHVQ